MTNRMMTLSARCLHSFGFAFLTLSLLAAPGVTPSSGQALAAAVQPADTTQSTCGCNDGTASCGSPVGSYDPKTGKTTYACSGSCAAGCTLAITTPVQPALDN